MSQRGKSKLWPWLVAAAEIAKNPIGAVVSAPVALEQAFEQIDHDKDTQQIKVDLQTILQALEQTPEKTLAAELGQLSALSGLTPNDLRRIVRRRARRLGLIPDADRLELNAVGLTIHDRP